MVSPKTAYSPVDACAAMREDGSDQSTGRSRLLGRSAARLSVGCPTGFSEVVTVDRSERILVDLPGGNHWNGSYQYGVRHPPLDEKRLEITPDLVGASLGSVVRLHNQDRAFIQLRMITPDHSSEATRGATECRVFDVDRADPFPATLDDVFSTGEPVAIAVANPDRHFA